MTRLVYFSLCLAIFLLGVMACNGPPVTNPGVVLPQGVETPTAVNLYAMAQTENAWNQGRLDVLTQTASRVTGYHLNLIPMPVLAIESIFIQMAESAMQQGQAPDIIQARDIPIVRWGRAGYLMPLQDCIAAYPQFNQVIDGLWMALTDPQSGQIYGIPLDVSLDMFHFNKAKLKQLGWSEQEIQNLPQDIQVGNFILADMLNWIGLAEERGIIRPGYGYWPGYNSFTRFPRSYIAFGGILYDDNGRQLVLDRNALQAAYLYHQQMVNEGILLRGFIGERKNHWSSRLVYRDTIVQGEVLFWTISHENWAHWSEIHLAGRGGYQALHQMMGATLYPSAFRGQPGYVAGAAVGAYAITTPAASGRTNQDAACALLAHTLTPATNAAHIMQAARLGVLKEQGQHPAYAGSQLLQETAYMLDYVGPLLGDTSPEARTYFEILSHILFQVEKGELTPAAAVNRAIVTLQADLETPVFVRE